MSSAASASSSSSALVQPFLNRLPDGPAINVLTFLRPSAHFGLLHVSKGTKACMEKYIWRLWFLFMSPSTNEPKPSPTHLKARVKEGLPAYLDANRLLSISSCIPGGSNVLAKLPPTASATDQAQALHKWMESSALIMAKSQLSVSERGLSQLPSDLTKFTNVTALDLTDNDFSTVPARVNKFQNLVLLDISHNPIHTIPDLHVPLSTLRVSYSLLTFVPPSITRLPLEVLDLSHNFLTALPSLAPLAPTLIKLYIDHNQFTKLPAMASLQLLEDASVSDNPLEPSQANVEELNKLNALPSLNEKSKAENRAVLALMDPATDAAQPPLKKQRTSGH